MTNHILNGGPTRIYESWEIPTAWWHHSHGDMAARCVTRLDNASVNTPTALTYVENIARSVTHST